jgi:hypothetical protein
MHGNEFPAFGCKDATKTTPNQHRKLGSVLVGRSEGSAQVDSLWEMKDEWVQTNLETHAPNAALADFIIMFESIAISDLGCGEMIEIRGCSDAAVF